MRTSPLNYKSISLVVFLLLLFSIGIGDTFYLVRSHYTGEALSCSITRGCDAVLTSNYSEFFGVPVALIGLVYYLLLFILAGSILSSGSLIPVRVIFGLLSFGVIFSLWLIYLQGFVIGAWCQYCLLSATITGIAFCLSLVLLYGTKQQDEP